MVCAFACRCERELGYLSVISDFIIVASVLNFEDGAGECHIMMCHRIDRQMSLSASFTVMERQTKRHTTATTR